jgi:hypothetical protein
MKSRQKKKNVNHEAEDTQSRSELVGRSLSHLNRSLRQFSEGLHSRVSALQERLVVEPLEGAAWIISQRVRKVQNRVFDFIDEKISLIDEARHRKMDHQTALERFDGEGGAMQPTTIDESAARAADVEKATEKTAGRSASKSARFAFEPTFQQ